jgi:hypothetical protein
MFSQSLIQSILFQKKVSGSSMRIALVSARKKRFGDSVR